MEKEEINGTNTCPVIFNRPSTIRLIDFLIANPIPWKKKDLIEAAEMSKSNLDRASQHLLDLGLIRASGAYLMWNRQSEMGKGIVAVVNAAQEMGLEG